MAPMVATPLNLLQAFREEFSAGFRAILAELRRERGENVNFQEQFFIYTFDGANEFVDLPAAVGGLNQGSFRIAATSDFYATAIVQRSPTVADPLAVDQPYSYRITEQSGDLVMSNNFIHARIGAGSGERPFFLPRPRRFGANGEVVVQLKNTQAVATRVFWAMAGWKIYFKEQMNLTARR
jgi:hypothetical protein